jgi:hypothetical protein
MTRLGQIIDFMSTIIGCFIGMYVAEEAMNHFGYYNRARVGKLLDEVMQANYRGQCLCFKP